MNKLLLLIVVILILVYILTLPCKKQILQVPEYFTNIENDTSLSSTYIIDNSDINYTPINENNITTSNENNIISNENNITTSNENNITTSNENNITTSNENNIASNDISNIMVDNSNDTSARDILMSFETLHPSLVEKDTITKINEHKRKDDFINNLIPNIEKKHNNLKKCSPHTCGTEDLYPVLEPTFNMREVAKQCILLEDHINNLKKRCKDCIRKHFLTIDGFLEESVSLEQDVSKRKYYRTLHQEWVKIEKLYAENSLDSDTLDEISKQIRTFRKPLVADYFDTVSDYDI